MLKKLVLLIYLMSFYSILDAQTDSTFDDISTIIDTTNISDFMKAAGSSSSNYHKKRKIMEMVVGTNLMQISNSYPFQRLGMNYSFQLGFYPIKKLAVGLFYAKMNDISKDNTYFIIDTKVINIASSELSNYGAYINYVVFKEDRIKIIPELQLGLGRYKAVSANFDINQTKNVIEFYLMTIQPKLRFAYDFSNTFGLGLSTGYLFPININNRPDFKIYNVQNFNVGLYLILRL